MQFENLSVDNLVAIALKLDITDITNFCRLNRKFNRAVCNNQKFWIQKLYIDFNMNYLDFNNPPTSNLPRSSNIRLMKSKTDTPKEFYEHVDKISKLTNFADTYKHTGYNIKLIDYYIESNGNVHAAIEEAAQLSDTREAIKIVSHLLKKGGSLKLAMYGATKSNNMYLIEYIGKLANETLDTPERITEVFNEGAKGAGYINDHKLMQYFMTKGADWRKLLIGLAEGGHVKSMENIMKHYIIDYLAYSWNLNLYNTEGELIIDMIKMASLNNRENVLEYLIGFKGGSWSPVNKYIYYYGELNIFSDPALMGAAYNNNRELIRKLIDENGATNMNMGLIGAVAGGVFELIDYFIEKGADAYAWAFSVAIARGSKNVADFLWNMKKFEINSIDVERLIYYKNKAAFRYIRDLGFDNWDVAINQAQNQDPTMVNIIEEVRDEWISYKFKNNPIYTYYH